MSPTLCPTATPRALNLHAAGVRPAPLAFHLLEDLLQARQGSMFPTNGAGPDEDVNIYLAHLLSGLLTTATDPQVGALSGPLFQPPGHSRGRRERAEWYRRNADHRLIHLGLFGWGDGLRRRNRLHGLTADETRRRDLSAGRTCYEAAALLLRDRPGSPAALVEIWEKIAVHFEDYVHVLGALATRRFGLGAQLGPAALDRLLPPQEHAATRAVDDLLTAPPPPGAIDALLDLWLAHQKKPEPATASRLRDMADRLGITLTGHAGSD